MALAAATAGMGDMLGSASIGNMGNGAISGGLGLIGKLAETIGSNIQQAKDRHLKASQFDDTMQYQREQLTQQKELTRESLNNQRLAMIGGKSLLADEYRKLGIPETYAYTGLPSQQRYIGAGRYTTPSYGQFYTPSNDPSYGNPIANTRLSSSITV